MRVIVSGTRYRGTRAHIEEAVKASAFRVTSVIHGGCPGIDLLAAEWARSQGIPTIEYPANWEEHGRSAGPIRNSEMVGAGQALIAIWDGESLGTRDVIRKAERAGLPVYIHPL